MQSEIGEDRMSKKVVKIDKKALAVKHAVSRNRARLILNCIKVSQKEIVATNGRILIRLRNDAEQKEGSEDTEFLLTPTMLTFIDKMFGPKKLYPLELEEVGEGKMRVKGYNKDFADVELKTRQEEGSFPNYADTVPTNVQKGFSLGVDLLSKVLQAAKAAGIEGIQFHFNPENMMSPLVLKGEGVGEAFTAVIMPRRT
jgi:hypothetical protein